MAHQEPVTALGATRVGLWKSPAYRLFLFALLAIGAASTAGLLIARRETPAKAQPTPPEAPSKELKEFAAKYCKSWGDRKPDLVILLTGQQHNYEAPCGCTEPQFGGLERRHNLFSIMRSLGLKLSAFDLGDMYYPGKLSDQAKLKYFMSMRALSQMGYDAVAVGPEEFRIPLLDALANTVLQNKFSFEVLAANIVNKDAFPAENGSMLKDFRVFEPKGSGLKVAVVGTLGQSAIDQIFKIDPSLDPKPDPSRGGAAEPSVKFGANSQVLPALLKQLNTEKPDVRVLLYQGTEKEAMTLAQTIDEFDVILCRTAESEPPGQPDTAPPAAGQTTKPKAKIIRVGQKGRFVGAVGVFRNGDKIEFTYDLISLSPEFRTAPDDRESQPALQLLEKYTLELKEKDYLSRYPQAQHPLQALFGKGQPVPKFVGSNECKQCHKAEFEVWDSTPHAGAFETLSTHPKAKPPSNRKFDGECVVCHTTGFGYQTGYRNEKDTPHLFGVGCEMCHGPGSLHMQEPKNTKYLAAMSPWKTNPKDYLTDRAIKLSSDPRRENAKDVPEAEQSVADRTFRFCFQCHDTDNDHNFSLDKWHKIKHGDGPTVKKKKE